MQKTCMSWRKMQNCWRIKYNLQSLVTAQVAARGTFCITNDRLLRDVLSKLAMTKNWIQLVASLNPTGCALVVWSRMLFLNSRGIKAAANLSLIRFYSSIAENWLAKYSFTVGDLVCLKAGRDIRFIISIYQGRCINVGTLRCSATQMWIPRPWNTTRKLTFTHIVMPLCFKSATACVRSSLSRQAETTSTLLHWASHSLIEIHLQRQ